MSSGGSGSSGNTQYNWNDTLKPLWESTLSHGQQLSQTPFQQNPFLQQDGPGGATYGVAGITPDQRAAMGNIENFVNGSGSPATIAANGQDYQTNSGYYLNGPGADPYANSQNPYSGYGPAFQQQLQGQLDDTTNAYQRGTAADTTRMFNLAGAFGGSANQNAVGANEYALARQLGNQTANAYQTQFANSGQLAGQDLNRASNAYQGERQRQIQAIAPGQNEQALALQRYNALMGVGDIQRGYSQDVLNAGSGQWQQQQQWPFQMQDIFSGLLGRAQGGVSPNSSFQNGGYSASPFSQVLGAGLLGYGLTR